MNEKIQINFYRLKEHNDMNSVREWILGTGLSEKELKKDEIDGFKLTLFYGKSQSSPKWKDFIQEIAKSDQDLSSRSISVSESFVLLIEKTKERIYCVTGGIGYFSIRPFIEDEFGLSVLSRIIKKDDRVLRVSKERNLTGGVLGSTKYFRSNFNLFENQSFGIFYQELRAKLDERILKDMFGFSEKEIKRGLFCIAKSSFSISKRITVNRALSIILSAEKVLSELPAAEINDVIPINRRDQKTISRLNVELDDSLWRNYSQDTEAFTFDLCDQEYEKYLTASTYVVRKGVSSTNFFGNQEFEKLDDISLLFDELRKSPLAPSNKDDFLKIVHSLKILSFSEDGSLLTENGLFKHLIAEIHFDDHSYFYVDKRWYQLRQSFIKNLNESCNSFFHESQNGHLISKKWSLTDDKNEFNAQFVGEENSLVLDRITPDGIEPCDLLRWDDDRLYIIHVKDGFGNTMRDLCSQLFIAAQHIENDRRGQKSYIKSVYRTLKERANSSYPYFEKIGSQVEQISEVEFCNLFEKKPVFILGMRDRKGRDFQNMQLFKSNIAKYSLAELIKKMRSIGVELSAVQIFSES